jgi:hypothetical protein
VLFGGHFTATTVICRHHSQSVLGDSKSTGRQGRMSATQSALGSIPRAKGTQHDDEKVEFIRQRGSASKRILSRTNR